MRTPVRIVLCLSVCFFSQTHCIKFAQAQPVTPWVAPKSADNIKNPLQGKKETVEQGKKIYDQLCSPCHGNKGKGDGIAGLALKPKPANFTSSKIQQQTDGALYWKLTIGRPPMAPYKDVLTEEKRWQLINYIRSLKK